LKENNKDFQSLQDTLNTKTKILKELLCLLLV